MFGFGKKKKEAVAQEAASADVYVAPVTGEYLPLSEVSDPVFSQGVMGDGYAVNPTAGTIVAPVAGTIALIQDTLHAFMLRTDNGGEVLAHRYRHRRARRRGLHQDCKRGRQGGGRRPHHRGGLGSHRGPYPLQGDHGDDYQHRKVQHLQGL